MNTFCIAVLRATGALSIEIAARLYRAALELYQNRESSSRFAGDLGEGRVRSLEKSIVLGCFAGPAFQADVEAPNGSLRVDFILTRRGIARGEEERLPN